MLFIVDKKIPEEAKTSIKKFGEILELETDGITDDYLSGHPDIFFCKFENTLIYAPNVPAKYLDHLRKYDIEFVKGNQPVKSGYPDCVGYNAVLTKKHIIHNLKLTDQAIFGMSENRVKVNVKQGFTRCSLLHLKDDCFITSDRGIEKTLLEYDCNVLFVDSSEIKLPGCKNGFFGGCAGVSGNKIFLLGSIDKIKEKDALISFTNKIDMEIIELYEDQLFDGGSLIII